MIYQNPDKSEVIDTVKLLLRGLMHHEGVHPLYIPTYEKWEVHHPHPGKVHEQEDMIGIQSREPPLTAKVFHDQPHEWSILILQVSEGKYSCELIHESGFDVRLIVFPIHLLLLMPLFSNIGIHVSTNMASGVTVKVTSAKID